MPDHEISNEDRQALIILIARKIRANMRVRVGMKDELSLAEEIVAIFHPLP